MPEDEVTFVPSDFFLDLKLEEVILQISDHFKVRRPYFPQYCKLIQTSKYWTVTSRDRDLDRWAQNFGKLQGTKKIIELIRRAFFLCETNKEIEELRGALGEALVISAYGGSEIIYEPNVGWGAKVKINNSHGSVTVKYECTNRNGRECDDRSTVDFGIWANNMGKFYECKVQPSGINCKEIKYMTELKQELSNQNLKHEMFFVCPDNRDSIELKLKEMRCTVLFKALGIKELHSLIRAS